VAAPPPAATTPATSTTIPPPGGERRSVGRVLERAGHPAEGVRALFVMNHQEGGFDCPGCAWPDDPVGLHLDLCENGVKRVTWELAPAKADRDFFAPHTGSAPGGRPG
jgi:hypothetical protein